MKVQSKIKNLSELVLTRLYFSLVFIISELGIYLVFKEHSVNESVYPEIISISVASLSLVIIFIDIKIYPFFKAVKIINRASDSNNIEPLPLFGEGTILQLLQNYNTQVYLRKLAEQRLERVSGLIKILNNIKKHSVRKSETELFDLLCQEIVSFSGFTMAWVGKPEQSSQRIIPIASSGLGLTYFQTAYISARADIPEGCGPTGRAYREKIPVVVNDYQASEMTKPWQPVIKKYGWQSAGAFPILNGNEPYAVFTVYSPDLSFFENEVIDLLSEISCHIGSALKTYSEQG